MIWPSLGPLVVAANGSTDPIPQIGYGALGAIFIAAVFGQIWFKPAVDNMIKRYEKQQELDLLRAEKAETQRDALMDVISKDVQPALTENIAANTALRPVLEAVVRTLEDVRLDMRDNRPRTPAPRRKGASGA